jgi:hypothetical protein
LFKTLKGSLEKFVAVKSVTGEEGNEVVDCASSQEDGNVTVETDSTAANVICIDIEMDRYDDPEN